LGELLHLIIPAILISVFFLVVPSNSFLKQHRRPDKLGELGGGRGTRLLQGFKLSGPVAKKVKKCARPTKVDMISYGY
jgi:hypothetical protein